MTEHLYITDEDKSALTSYIENILNVPIIAENINFLINNAKELKCTVHSLGPETCKILRKSLSGIIINDIQNIVCYYIDGETDICIYPFRIYHNDNGLFGVQFVIYAENFSYTISCTFPPNNMEYILHIHQHTPSHNSHVIEYVFVDYKTSIFLFNFDDIHPYAFYNDEIEFMNYYMKDDINIPYFNNYTEYQTNDEKNVIISHVSITKKDFSQTTFKLIRTIINETQLKENIKVIKFVLEHLHHIINEHYVAKNSKNELDALI